MATAIAQHRRAPTPQRTEDCAICRKTGCLTADGWFEDYLVERDGDGYYLAGHGEYFSDAVDTPSGWACSKRCRSQEMYQRASKFEKESLRKVHDACRLLTEYGVGVRSVMSAGTDDGFPDKLIVSACDFLTAVADDGDSMPDWCNREVGADA